MRVVERRVRLLKPADVNPKVVEAVNTLLEVLHRGPGADRTDIRQLKSAAAKSYVFLAYDAADHIVGMATLILQERVAKRTGYLNDVVVLPDVEGRGFASLLMQVVDEQGRQLGIRHIDLTSSNERKRSHLLYARKGYKERDTKNFRLTL